MKLLFVCLSADTHDPLHAVTVRWIETLAARPEIDHLTVLALRAGTLPPLANATIRQFRGRGRLQTVRTFYAEAHRALRGGLDACFVYQSGPYPVLVWPLARWYRVPVYYWKAHPRISVWTWLSARVVADKVFTPTPASLPIASPKVIVVGHGVDVAQFVPAPAALPDRDLITVGRVAPSKRIDVMLRAVARCNDRFGSRLRFDIVGPVLAQDDHYRAALEHLVGSLGLSSLVKFHGPVVQSEVPEMLRRHRLALNFSSTALDKGVIEAMACGVPVLSTNPAAAEILPSDLRVQLTAPPDDTDAQAETMHRLMALTDRERADLGASLRALIVRDHNLDRLIGRILQEMGPTP